MKRSYQADKDWTRKKIYTPVKQKQNKERDMGKLEDTLLESWRELDRMLFCSKISMCANRYRKNFKMGQVNVNANLVQSLTITLHQIKDITGKLRKMKDAGI